MGHDRHRSTVDVRIRAAHVAARHAARRIRPVQRLIDRQQVRQTGALVVDELIDPFHAHHPRGPGFERRRRVMEGRRIGQRSISPHRGPSQRRRKDLLRELAHANRVVIGGRVDCRARHRRRNEQRTGELRDRGRRQGAAGNLSVEARPYSELARQVCAGADGRSCTKKRAPSSSHASIGFLYRPALPHSRQSRRKPSWTSPLDPNPL
jgi:hypothetical protein